MNPNTITAAQLASLNIAPAVLHGVTLRAETPAEQPRETPPGARNEQTNPAARWDFDAALPAAPEIGPLTHPMPFATVLQGWRSQIEAEHLFDVKVAPQLLSMRNADGALVRGNPGGLAYTPHGFSQLISLMLKVKPNNLAGCMRWLSPTTRALAYQVDVKGRSARPADDLLVLRTYRAPRPGVQIPGQPNIGVQAIRAVVSTRHSAQYLDDKALSGALESEISADAQAQVVRSVDFTHGYAEVGEAGPHLIRTLQWSNSETGCASLGFSAGAIIRIVDAKVVVGHEDVGTEDEVRATVAADHSRERMRHTAPGGKSDEALKAEVATGRMRAKIRKVLVKGEQIAAAWDRALASFPAAIDAEQFAKLESAVAFEIIVDAIEEKTGITADDRAALLALLNDDKRLGGSKTLPRGTAAHVAAAFAVLGERSKTIDDQKRFQEIAGLWLMKGW